MNTVTEAQINLINRLKTERDLSLVWTPDNGTDATFTSSAARASLDVLRDLWTHGEATKQGASHVIEALLKAPYLPGALAPTDAAPAPAAETESLEGMHRVDGAIYKVQRAVHGSGRLYAKVLVQEGYDWSFEYAAGALRRLSAATRLTLEEAKEWGALYGSCCVCSKTLTNEESIAAGIGPVCAGRL